MKTTKIYDTCVDTAAIERRRISPLKNLIKQYGGWTVTGDGTNSWTVATKMGAVLRDLNVQTLLSISVETDLQDSSQHILRVSIMLTIFTDICAILISWFSLMLQFHNKIKDWTLKKREFSFLHLRD